MAYIGSIGDKVEIEVKVKGIYTYTTGFGYGWQENHIYSFEDAEGNSIVWKTQKGLSILTAKRIAFGGNGRPYRFEGKERKDTFDGYDKIHEVSKGDVITIRASVKAHEEYKGQEQTSVQRVKITGVSFFALTKEEWMEQKREEQFHSLEDGDFVWKMPYRQFKEHYADCETIVGSCNKDNPQRICTVEVIIRNGRLKASGVRGEHFYGFDFSFDYEGKNTSCVFRAVSEDNARKQLAKAFKGAENIELERVW